MTRDYEIQMRNKDLWTLVIRHSCGHIRKYAYLNHTQAYFAAKKLLQEPCVDCQKCYTAPIKLSLKQEKHHD
jgi:hypothetical protein